MVEKSQDNNNKTRWLKLLKSNKRILTTKNTCFRCQNLESDWVWSKPCSRSTLRLKRKLCTKLFFNLMWFSGNWCKTWYIYLYLGSRSRKRLVFLLLFFSERLGLKRKLSTKCHCNKLIQCFKKQSRWKSEWVSYIWLLHYTGWFF